MATIVGPKKALIKMTSALFKTFEATVVRTVYLLKPNISFIVVQSNLRGKAYFKSKRHIRPNIALIIAKTHNISIKIELLKTKIISKNGKLLKKLINHILKYFWLACATHTDMLMGSIMTKIRG